MYNNAGKSIKNLTKVIVGIEMALAVIAGIAIMVSGGLGFWLGLLVAGLGCFFAWVGGLVMYAYGDIADNLQAIRNKTVGEEEKVEYTVETGKKVMIEAELLAEGAWECVSCKTQNPLKRQYCIKCGTNRDWSEEKSKKKAKAPLD